MGTKLKIGIAATVLILFTVLLTDGVLIPKQIQGDVLSVRFLHLKPSLIGLQATFELRNDNGPKVDLWSAALSDSDADRLVGITPITMEKGDTTRVEIEVPTEGKWQIRFYVNRHPKSRYRRGTLVYTEWIDSTGELPRNP